MFSHLLIPLDGSAAAEAAMDYAVSLAQAYKSHTLLFRARPHSASYGFAVDFPIPEEIFEQEGKACLAYLDAQAEKLASRGLSVSTQVGVGEASDLILWLAEEKKIDLIVMTSHGRTGLRRFVMGSVAERISRHAHCPVMIVGRPPASQAAIV